MTCPKCSNTGTTADQAFCGCEFGSIRRMTANRQAVHAYSARPHTDAYDDRTTPESISQQTGAIENAGSWMSWPRGNVYIGGHVSRNDCTGHFPDDTIRNCHSQILTSLSIMDRCKRRDLVRVVCSHEGCESRSQIERELDELVASKQVGLDPDWDLNSTDGDDIVYHIVKTEWQPTKEQEEACEERKKAARKSRIANLWICIGAFIALLSILYAIAQMIP